MGTLFFLLIRVKIKYSIILIILYNNKSCNEHSFNKKIETLAFVDLNLSDQRVAMNIASTRRLKHYFFYLFPKWSEHVAMNIASTRRLKPIKKQILQIEITVAMNIASTRRLKRPLRPKRLASFPGLQWT